MAGIQWRQLIWIAIGVAGMFVISRIDYHTLLDQAPVLYVFGLATLSGRAGDRPFRGLARKRWVEVGGGVNLQVSELMKLIIIIVLARFFAEVRTDRMTLLDLVKLPLLTAIP